MGATFFAAFYILSRNRNLLVIFRVLSICAKLYSKKDSKWFTKKIEITLGEKKLDKEIKAKGKQDGDKQTCRQIDRA